VKAIIGIATAVIALSACATAPATSYEAAASLNSSGHLTVPADNGRHTIVYTGAKGMSREQVAAYALLRAAEFTVESGQEWFAVIDTKNQKVELARGKDDLQGRSGGFISGGESAGAGAGGAGATASPAGVSDSTTQGGPSTGGFGGGDVPYQVLERWTPPTVHQTVIVIQMGKDSQATFRGLNAAPEIFAAKSTAAEIRGRMKP
jgi:hypothetical protein